MNRLFVKIICTGGFLFLLLTAIMLAGNGLKPAGAPPHTIGTTETLSVSFQPPFLRFALNDDRVAQVRLAVWDGSGNTVSDSGELDSAMAEWDGRLMPPGGGALTWGLQAWDGEGVLIQWLEGEILPGEAAEELLVAAPFDVAGNFTIGGNLGVGTTAPERAVHIKGNNAVLRMDRSQNTAAFMIVRTDAAGVPQKTFVVGVDASGPNQGQLVINDLGSAVTGGGTRRMTIANTGEVTFTGNVRAAGFYTSSGAVTGLTAVAHDSSLSGDGTTSSLLGVADGGVTPAMLDVSGSTAGEVLTSDGTGVSWQTPMTEIIFGITSVVHDGTLTGNGVACSPLGLADYAVTTAKLYGNAVTEEKLASDSVSSSKIVDGAVGPQDLATGAVRQTHLAAAVPSADQVLSYNGTNLQWVNQAGSEANNGTTRLLFPFATNMAGFDTGVCIANTGSDPFGTTGGSGTVTVYYYGSMASGGALPSPQTSITIDPGEVLNFSLSSGGIPGSASSAAGFQGYIIAVCNFPFAHGFYMLNDFGFLRYATSGHAIVLPATRDATVVEARGQ